MQVITENITLLDLKGLVLRSLYANDKHIGPATDSFIKEVILPELEIAPARRIIACLDSHSDYRYAIFPEYKAHRKGRDDALETDAMEAAMGVLKAMGVRLARANGAEADDLIAYFCEALPGNKRIVTIDGDMAALVSPSVHAKIGHDTYSDSQSAGYKGVPFHLTAIWKAIVGDSSDGYQGVKGMGPVAARRLVDNYGWDGLEELEGWVKAGNPRDLTDAAASTGDKDLQALVDGWNSLVMGYRLASLRPQDIEHTVSGGINKVEWTARLPDREKYDQAVTACGGMLDSGKLPGKVFREDVLVTADNLTDVWQEIFLLIPESPIVAIDYESYDTLKHPPFQEAKKGYVDVMHQRVTGMSITCGRDMTTTFYFSTEHANTNNLDVAVLGTLLEWCKDSGIELIAHNAAFETVLSLTNLKGVDLGEVIDTYIMSMYVDENVLAGLKNLSSHYLRYSQTSYDEVTGGKDMCELSGEEVLGYGCDDSICSAWLFNLFNDIQHLEGTAGFCAAKEYKTTRLLVDSYMEGDTIDFEELGKQKEEAEKIVRLGNGVISDLVSQNCTELSQERATPLFYDLWDFQSRTKEWESAEKMEEARIKLWNEVYYASAAASVSAAAKPVTDGKTPKFVASAKALNKALAVVGVTEELASVSNKGITEWVSRVRPESSDPMGLTGEGDSKAEALIQAILNCSGKMRDKNSEERKHLEAVFMEIMGGGQAVVAAEIKDEINVGSPKQMQQLLYVKMGLPIRCRVQVKPGTRRHALDMQGAPATDEHAIRVAIAEDTEEGDWKNRVLMQCLDVIKAKTRISNYFDKYPLWKSPDDGKVHGQVRNCGTVSLRPSSSQPNRLQIEKGDFRKCFKPYNDDHVIVTADFSGQELRILGSESRDPLFLEAYLSKPELDIHSNTAVGIVPILYEHTGLRNAGLAEDAARAMTYEEFERLRSEDTPLGGRLRKIRNAFAKPLNFLIIYGGGPKKLAAKLMIKEDLASTMIDAWKNRYYGVGTWKDNTIMQAMKDGYTRTAYGHRRHLAEDLNSDIPWKRGRAERQMLNNIIQGGAAGILKTVMASAYDSGLFSRYGARQILPIYDEIRASVPKKNIGEYAVDLVKCMEVTPPGHDIGMVAEVSVCFPTWGDKVEIGRVDLKNEDDIERFKNEVLGVVFPQESE